jgi:dipeptide/tripeptide permease
LGRPTLPIFILYDTDSIENDATNNSYIVVAVTLLTSRCLTTVAEIHIQTNWWLGFNKYAVEMASCVVIYIV